jgi:ATP-binding protein involved in chromosome partitioning
MRIFSEFEREPNHGGPELTARDLEDIASNLVSVRSVLAIASPKGGTGKSAVAVNIAAALARAGKKVAVVDADFNAPSILAMLGMKPPRCLYPGEAIEPASGPFGLRTLSAEFFSEGEPAPVSFLTEEDPTATANHAPPVVELSHSAALRRLLGETRFGAIDMLILDLAPGLEQLYRLLRIFKVNGILLVTRPSVSAARHVCSAFDTSTAMGVPVLGVVENMVGFSCEICRSVKPLFPEGETSRVVRERLVPLIARLPFDPRFAECSERGTPFVHQYADTPMARQLAEVARQVESLALKSTRVPTQTATVNATATTSAPPAPPSLPPSDSSG